MAQGHGRNGARPEALDERIQSDRAAATRCLASDVHQSVPRSPLAVRKVPLIKEVSMWRT